MSTQPPVRIIGFVGPLYDRLQPLSYPFMRFITGLFLMPHGADKLFGTFGGGIEQTAGFFAHVGLQPALPLAYLVGGTEFFGGLCIAIGLLTRPAAFGVIILMAVAIFGVHLPHGFFAQAGGFEYPALWGAMALGILIRGGGELSVDRAIGREF